MKKMNDFIDINFFGENSKFHHVGIAVKSFEQVFSNLSLTSIEFFEDELLRVRVGFIKINGLSVEIIEPLDEKSPISNALLKNIKLVHLCYEVDDIHQSTLSAKKYGFTKVTKVSPANAFNKRNIVFLYSQIYGLFELIER
jgi:methylmalonyl-CoA/ethylmalonyl-CoA epimerase